MINKIIIIGLIIVSLFATTGCIETGKESATDTIYSVGMDGLIWKTYVVYLSNDHPSAGSKDNEYSAVYTVDKDNTELIKFLEDARDNQRKVKVYYTNNVGYFPWEHTTNAVGLIYKAEYI